METSSQSATITSELRLFDVTATRTAADNSVTGLDSLVLFQGDTRGVGWGAAVTRKSS